MKKAFTMIELIFVIVVIGILSAIAIPKFAVTRNDAVIMKAKTTIASVRSAISSKRQKNILKSVFTDLNASSIGTNFSELLEYGVKSCSTSGCNGWSTNGLVFTFHGPTGDVSYTYQNKKLECTSSNERCKEYGD
jgi:general secretion pathway protein G